MAKKQNILIVDDTPTEIHLLIEHLKHEYAIQVATSGVGALALLEGGYAPDVILLDVVMPDMNGYEVCKRINQQKNNPQKIEVIFVSAHDTVEEKLAGYEAGGSDYLIKPIVPDELMQKVKLALKNREARKQLHEEMESVVVTAMTALSVNTEQEVLVDFYRQCLTDLTPKALATLLVHALSRYFLVSSVQLRSAQGIFEYGEESGILPPLESELIHRLKDKGNLVEPNNRVLVNRGPVSILVKNFPEDPGKNARLKTIIGIMAESAADKLRSIDAQAEQALTIEHLKPYIQRKATVFDEILAQQKQQKARVMLLVDELAQRFEADFLSLGFLESQEKALMDILHNCTDELLSNYEKGVQLDEQLSQVFSELKFYAGG